MKYSCCAIILLNFYEQAIFKLYVVPKFNLTKNLHKIYRLFKLSNVNYLKNRVEARDTSMEKVGDNIGLSAPMKKIG